MNSAHYDRLSTLDAGFLNIEDNNSPMHVGSIGLVEAEPMTLEDGSLDFDRIERIISQVIPRNPRLFQKVWWPNGGPPVWIDDENFDLGFHFRRVALPSPGTLDELRELCGRILSMRLDVTRPLWETWIIEGIEGDKFAIFWKLHHALADGVAVRDILVGYLGFEPSSEVPKPIELSPRPAPTLGQLYRDEALFRIEKTREVSQRIGDLLRGSGPLADSVAEVANGVLTSVATLLSSPTPTRFNKLTGPHRRYDWTSTDFEELSEIRKHSGAKINDIALSVVAGAMRSYLLKHEVEVDDLDFRVMVPVNVRTASDAAGMGNHVSNMAVSLPLSETDPRRRLQKTMEATTRAKASGQSRIGEIFTLVNDWAGIHAPTSLARFTAQRLTANLVVTNIPGPMFPQYLGESLVLGALPVVPLSANQGLGIALYGYNQKLYWGFNADRDLMPDLADLVRAIDAEMDLLYRAFQPRVEMTRRLRAVEGKAPAKTTRKRAKAKRAPVDAAPAKESAKEESASSAS